MHCLEVITSASFQSPPRINGEHNRDCSCVKSRGGFVCHSAAARSTFFVSAMEYPESFHLIECMRGNRVALNVAIESLQEDYSVPQAWRNVIRMHFALLLPEGWTIRGGDGGHAPVPITVEIPCKGGKAVYTFPHFPAAFNGLAALVKGGAK